MKSHITVIDCPSDDDEIEMTQEEREYWFSKSVCKFSVGKFYKLHKIMC